MLELYTTNNCQYCNVVKMILNERGLKYTEYNLSDHTNKDKLEEMVQLTGRRSVPVLRNGDRFVIGSDKSEIVKVIGG